MKKDKRKKYISIIIIVLFLALLSVMTYLSIPIIKGLMTAEGRVVLQEKVASFGFLAPLFYLLFCIFQVIIALIPGEPVEIIGGILFGPFWGTILCFAGSVLGMIFVYYLVKIIGKPLIDVIVGKKKYSELKILNNEKRLELLVFTLFLIPGTPKDALTYIVPITKIEPKKYFIYANLARLPSIVSSTVIGSTLKEGDFFYTILITLITIAIALIGIFFNDKLMKKIHRKNKK